MLTGASRTVTISNQNTAVDSQRVTIERGHSKFGMKHVVLRHYKSGEGWLTEQDLLNLADVIKKANHSISYGANKYVFVDHHGTRFTVITTADNKEKLVTYYSNRDVKKPPTAKP